MELATLARFIVFMGVSMRTLSEQFFPMARRSIRYTHVGRNEARDRRLRSVPRVSGLLEASFSSILKGISGVRRRGTQASAFDRAAVLQLALGDSDRSDHWPRLAASRDFAGAHFVSNPE
jgi:hypothetical protein